MSEKKTTTYIYHDEQGNEVHCKDRIEEAGKKKTFNFRHSDNGQLVYTRRNETKLLYNLPELIKSPYAFVVEGEALVECLKELGLVATTLDAGSNSPWLEEYNQHFKNKTKVVILPDADKPGMAYAENIANSLWNVVPNIKIVQLPGLAEKEDVVQWIGQRNGKPREELKTELFELIKAAPVWTTEVEEEPQEEIVTEFNFKKLPDFLQSWTQMFSPSTLAPNEFIVTSLLTAMSAAIGTRAYVRFGSMEHYPTLWLMIIASSSDTFKSTAIKLSRKFISKKDKELEEVYLEEKETYDKSKKDYDLMGADEKRYKDEPVPPIRQEILFAIDETIESFYRTLHENPNGGLLSQDELGSWLQSFGKYKAGVGDGEMRRWLSIFDNDPFKYKRIKDKTNLTVDLPFVSITGAITPVTFNSQFAGNKDIENGFLPRFLFCKNPPLVKPDASFERPPIDQIQWDEAYRVFESVMNMNSGAVELSSAAKLLVNDWYKSHQAQKKLASFPPELSPFWRRLEAYLLKFALVIHQFKRALNKELSRTISAETMEQAMYLIEYFKGQTNKVVTELFQAEEEQETKGLIEILKRYGGKASTRQIVRGSCYWGKKGVKQLKKKLKDMERDEIVKTAEVKPKTGGNKLFTAKLL